MSFASEDNGLMNLQDWLGREETIDDVVTATPYAALSATLDWPPPPGGRPAAGTHLPYLWHWLYFLPLHQQSEIGGRRPSQTRRLPAAGAAAAAHVGGQPA
jgi:hydroxyacyl-ACP dehydratase HTD2-like protein with hotdog domain